MGIVVIGHAPSREMYDAVVTAMAEVSGGEMPAMDGLVVHTASQLADGRVQIVDVWESADAEQNFTANFLMPAFAKAGVPEEAMAEGAPDRTETFELVK